MEEELKILTAFISRTLNIEPVKVAALLKTDEGKIKDNAVDALLNLDATRVADLKSKAGNTTEAFDNGYKKAHKEVADKIDGDIRTHYEIETDLKGVDLVGAVLKAKTKAIEEKQLTPDEIKTNPIYQTAITNLTNQHTKAVEELKNTHLQEIGVYKKKESLTGVISAADQLIDSKIKPIFSADSSRANNQRKLIHDAISNGNFKENPGGMPIVLDKDGKALEDEHGIPVPFESFVKNKVTSFLDIQTTEPREGGGKPPEEVSGDEVKKWNGQKPKDVKEYGEAIKNASSPEEKLAIQKSYRSTE